MLRCGWLLVIFAWGACSMRVGAFQLAPPPQPPKISIHLNSPDHVISVATSVEALAQWGGGMVAALEGTVAGTYSQKDFYLLTQLTLRPNMSPVFKLAGNPQPGSAAQVMVAEALNRHPPPPVKWLPVTLSFSMVSGNAKEEPGLLPAPHEAFEKRFSEARGGERAMLLREWCREWALAVIGAYCASAGPEFEGVTHIGEVFSKAAAGEGELDSAAVDADEKYWMSIMEMVPGAPMTAAARIFLDGANGRFDQAENMARFLIKFTNSDCLAQDYLREFLKKLNTLRKDQAPVMKEIVELIDKERHKEALAAIDRALKMYPYDARLHHEQALIHMRDKDGKFKVAHAKIFECDPMYSVALNAETGKDAFRLGRRLKIKELFKNPEDRLADMMTMGHIALDLDAPNIAATWFWHLSLIDNRETAEALKYYLYSLDKMGFQDLKTQFKGNWPETFKEIDQKRQKAMEEDTYYKAMAVK